MYLYRCNVSLFLHVSLQACYDDVTYEFQSAVMMSDRMLRRNRARASITHVSGSVDVAVRSVIAPIV